MARERCVSTVRRLMKSCLAMSALVWPVAALSAAGAALYSPMRPLECNLQRFYFRECKPYELDHRSADPQDRKKFWNAVESFGRYYPPAYYTILSENEATYWLGEAGCDLTKSDPSEQYTPSNPPSKS